MYLQINNVLYICIFGFIICLVIYWIITLMNIEKLNCAMKLSMQNDLFCLENEGANRLKCRDNLNYPLHVDGIFSYVIARYCADLITRVSLLFRQKYKETSLKMPPGMKNEKTLYFRGNIIGFIGSKDSYTWISFRGTSTNEEWRTDFKFMQIGLNIQEKQTNIGHMNCYMSCHKGFVEVFEHLKKDIVNTLRESRASTIIVTGHSLGAGIASLTCLHLQTEYTVLGYMFGSPRVCARLPTNKLKGFFRIDNTTDPIPQLPLSVMWNLQNNTKPFLYEHGGSSLTFTINRGSITNNHLMPVYIEALDDRLLKQATRI